MTRMFLMEYDASLQLVFPGKECNSEDSGSHY